MIENEKQLDQRARDLAFRLDATDLYDVVGTKAILADMADFHVDFCRVYNLED
jgi:hypothetical protein